MLQLVRLLGYWLAGAVPGGYHGHGHGHGDGHGHAAAPGQPEMQMQQEPCEQ